METICVNFPTMFNSVVVEILVTLALIGLAISGVGRIFAILCLGWDLLNTPLSDKAQVIIFASMVIVGTFLLCWLFYFFGALG